MVHNPNLGHRLFFNGSPFKKFERPHPKSTSFNLESFLGVKALLKPRIGEFSANLLVSEIAPAHLCRDDDDDDDDDDDGGDGGGDDGGDGGGDDKDGDGD